MKIENIVPLIMSTYRTMARRKKTLFLLGPSGVGKSESIAEAVKELDVEYKAQQRAGGTKEGEELSFGFIDLRLAHMDPVEFGGVPSVTEEGYTRKNPPDWLPRPGTAGIIVLDEITSAPPAMQAPAYQFTNDRKFGDTPLPDGWMVIAAGNRASDRGVTFPMAAPLLARMTVINVESSLDGFLDFCARSGVRGEVIAFIKSRPDYLNERDETINTHISELPLGKPFATQRGWSSAVQHYLDDAAEQRLELIKGSVGERAAADFEAFLRIWETMPSIDKIFSDPDAVDVPKDSATRYAVSIGVSMRITNKNFDKAVKYLNRMPGEFMALAIKLAYKRDKGISECKAFVDWVTKNPNLFKRGA